MNGTIKMRRIPRALNQRTLTYFVKGSITSCFTGSGVTKKVNLCNKAAESKPVKQDVSHTVILPLSKLVSVLCQTVAACRYKKL